MKLPANARECVSCQTIHFGLDHCPGCGQPLQKVAAKKTKYRNVPVRDPVDGYFASRKEYARWRELKLMEKAGDIFNLRRQVIYRLVVNNEPITKYVADFVYESYGTTTVVEDAKGIRTDVYKIKARLMKAVLGIEVKEV